jgi:hypothetical protein
MAPSACPSAISHQNVRLGPGRHPRPGKIVCVMELASMLAGERFGDRPPSVCPVIGAILRVYNDNVDDCRRQDLYRFAADVVDTRRDYAVQRLRADAALEWAIARYESRGGTILSPPDPEGPRDQIAYYVVGALIGRGSRRGRWSDEEHGAIIGLLEELIELDRPATLGTSLDDAVLHLIVDGPGLGHDTPLIGDLLEHAPESIEHSSRYHEFVLGEGLECGAEERLEPGPVLFDQPTPAVGERGEHHAPVALGTLALDEAGCGEPLQHLGHARRAEVGGLREVAHRQLTLVAKAEQQAVLRVGELARAVGLAPAHPSERGQRTLERSRHLLGGVAVLALAYHVSKRR